MGDLETERAPILENRGLYKSHARGSEVLAVKQVVTTGGELETLPNRLGRYGKVGEEGVPYARVLEAALRTGVLQLQAPRIAFADGDRRIQLRHVKRRIVQACVQHVVLAVGKSVADACAETGSALCLKLKLDPAPGVAVDIDELHQAAGRVKPGIDQVSHLVVEGIRGKTKPAGKIVVENHFIGPNQFRLEQRVGSVSDSVRVIEFERSRRIESLPDICTEEMSSGWAER